jgi:hypothetical protein
MSGTEHKARRLQNQVEGETTDKTPLQKAPLAVQRAGLFFLQSLCNRHFIKTAAAQCLSSPDRHLHTHRIQTARMTDTRRGGIPQGPPCRSHGSGLTRAHKFSGHSPALGYPVPRNRFSFIGSRAYAPHRRRSATSLPLSVTNSSASVVMIAKVRTHSLEVGSLQFSQRPPIPEGLPSFIAMT